MRNKQPFSCRGILVVYNLGLTLLSLYMFYEVGERVWAGVILHCLVQLYWHVLIYGDIPHKSEETSEKFCYHSSVSLLRGENYCLSKRRA